jgi:hypothetical protein
MRPLVFFLALTVAFSVGVGGQAPAQPRTFLLFFDDLHLDFQNTPRLRALAMRLVQPLLPEGDVIGRITGNGLRPREFLDARQGPDGIRELRRRAAIAFSTAISAINYMARAQGDRRFVILYFSSGYDAGLSGDSAELIKTANRANVAIYVIDPRGFSNAAAHGVDQADWDTYIAATQSSLRVLADRTQGMVVFNADDVDTVLSRLRR